MPAQSVNLRVFKKGDVKLEKSRFESRSPILDTPEWATISAALKKGLDSDAALQLELSKSTLAKLQQTMKRPLFNFYAYVRKFMVDENIPFERVKTENNRKVGKQYIWIFGGNGGTKAKRRA